MTEFADLVRSVASLLWPLLVIGILFVLLPTVRAMIGRSDSFSVEVGGTKISIQRASEEVRKLIGDLQDRVNALEETKHENRSVAPFDAPVRDGRSVLWVDDRLEANVYERARLQDAGYRVVQAESTTTALNLLRSAGPFDLVISDMARIEASGVLNTRAGLDLLRQMRVDGLLSPVVFYSSRRALEPVQAELQSENDVSYTTSPTDLMRLIGVSES